MSAPDSLLSLLGCPSRGSAGPGTPASRGGHTPRMGGLLCLTAFCPSSSLSLFPRFSQVSQPIPYKATATVSWSSSQSEWRK